MIHNIVYYKLLASRAYTNTYLLMLIFVCWAFSLYPYVIDFTII